MKRIDLFSRTTLARAVAELVLIVAGILIALAVDGAISERRNRTMARESLELVREDLRLLVEQVREFQTYSGNQLASGARLTRVLSADSPLPRTVETWRDLIAMTQRRTLRLPRAAWDELVGTGNLRLLDDAALRRDLVRFYETVARDQEIVTRNNTAVVDDLGLGILVGEGLVLTHRRTGTADIPATRGMLERMREAGFAAGPTFRGRIWRLPHGHPERVRVTSVVLTVSHAAAMATTLAEGIRADATGLIERIDRALRE